MSNRKSQFIYQTSNSVGAMKMDDDASVGISTSEWKTDAMQRSGNTYSGPVLIDFCKMDISFK